MDLVEYGFMNLGYNPDNTIPMQDKMSASFSSFMLGLLIYALLPAIAEEIVFRGVIQKSMLSKSNCRRCWRSLIAPTAVFVWVLHIKTTAQTPVGARISA